MRFASCLALLIFLSPVWVSVGCVKVDDPIAEPTGSEEEQGEQPEGEAYFPEGSGPLLQEPARGLLAPDPSAGLTVRFLGLSSGEATLVQAGGRSILIDCGSASAYEELDAYLQRYGVRKLDWLILTNEMPLHIGGMERLLAEWPVEKILVPQLIYKTIVDERTSGEDGLLFAAVGEKMELAPLLSLFVLHPSEPLSLAPQANSLVFQLRYGEIKLLFTSGINGEVEKRLAKEFDLQSQILKVSDFGSEEASDDFFLKKVDAQTAVIFHDGEEREGKGETRERLSESWIDIYETKEHGTITIFSDGQDYAIQKEK
ncbi:hypothetical protein BSNK01_13940 [Bacillaceae bacterium]